VTTTRTRSITAAAALLALVLTGCGAATDHSAMDQGAPMASAGAADSGRTADISFAQLMIPHHQQAVEMAQMAVGRTTGPEVKRLAEQILAAQEPEITQMRGWLSKWGAPEQMPGASGSHGSMDHSGMDMGGMSSEGMMSAEDMAELMDAQGAEFDRLWLTMMIAHHEGAILMANQVLTSTKDDSVKRLAVAIVEGQTTEVETMQAVLDQ